MINELFLMHNKNQKLVIPMIVALGIVGVVIFFVLFEAYRPKLTDGGKMVPGKNATEVSLTCTNGYTIKALYYAPDADGVMHQLALTVVHDGSARRHDMKPTISGSGARYSDKDGVYTFWEHQEEFTFSKGEEALGVCHKADSGSSGGTMTEAQARSIAEKSCIKGGEALGDGTYNENTKTWWFDANLNSTRKGCNPACVVSEGAGTAEINWRCTGLLQ